MIAVLPAADRVALATTEHAIERQLRERTGFLSGHPDPRRLGYCGREFRTYGRLRVGEAVEYYGAIAPIDRALLARYLALANLDPGLSIRRMKRAYHRALVLALIAAASPQLLVVEGTEDFNEAPAAALLEAAIAASPRAIVTGEDTSVPNACVRVTSIDEVFPE